LTLGIWLIQERVIAGKGREEAHFSCQHPKETMGCWHSQNFHTKKICAPRFKLNPDRDIENLRPLPLEQHGSSKNKLKSA